MMAALRYYQAPSNLWRQLVDEMSCTGMFTYAMIVGAKHGWLGLCVGTNQKDETQYYLDRPRATGDLHGQAPVLWCAWALVESK